MYFKILPFTENDDDHLVKSCKNIFKRLFNEKIGLKHSNLDFSQSQSSSVFQIYTSNKVSFQKIFFIFTILNVFINSYFSLHQ